MFGCDPKVNISVIAYNQEEFIEEAVMSCINQDYNNLTVIVSDDGSTDSTPLILSQLQEKYPSRLKVILNKKNQGITKNCNTVLSHCEGELIAFAAGDDVLYENKVSKQVSAFLANPDLVLCYHPVHVLLDGKIVSVSGDKRKDKVSDFRQMIGGYGADISGSVVMVARHAIPRDGFNEDLKTASDWLFFIEVSSKGAVFRIDDVLSKYRKHNNNIGHKVFDYADDFLKTLDIVSKKYPSDRGVTNSINKGRRRFLLGIIANAIIMRNGQAFAYYIRIYKDYGYFGGFLLPMLNTRVVRFTIRKAKKAIKYFY